jgi:GABA permease
MHNDRSLPLPQAHRPGDGTAPPSDLAHTLRPRHVVMISLGGIIGAGIFVGSSAAIHIAGPAVLLSYALGGLLVLCIMRMLAEMACANPGRGSFAEYAALGLGRWAAFMTGWLYWYYWVITIGVETVAGAKLLQPWLRHMGVEAPIWEVGLILISIMTATNLFSVKVYGELEFWFALLKVVVIAVFIVAGGAFLVFLGPGLRGTYHTLAGDGGLFPAGVHTVFAVIPIVIFSMMGSEVATIAAAESAQPADNIVRAVRTVALRILIFYVLSIGIIVAIVPWRTLPIGLSPFVIAFDAMHIPGAAPVMSFIVLAAVLSCLNSGLYITSRMLHELARTGDAPRFLAAIGGNRVPKLGILIGSVAGFLAATASVISPNKVFLFLINTSGAIILLIYIVIALGQIRLRLRLEGQGVQLPLKMWLFPWLSWVVVAGITVVLILMALETELRSQLLWSIVSVAVISAAYALRQWRKAAVRPHR